METPKEKINKLVKKAENIIESADELVSNNMVKSQHGSEDFKEYQRISNALLNVIRAIDALKYEL